MPIRKKSPSRFVYNNVLNTLFEQLQPNNIIKRSLPMNWFSFLHTYITSIICDITLDTVPYYISNYLIGIIYNTRI